MNADSENVAGDPNSQKSYNLRKREKRSIISPGSSREDRIDSSPLQQTSDEKRSKKSMGALDGKQEISILYLKDEAPPKYMWEDLPSSPKTLMEYIKNEGRNSTKIKSQLNVLCAYLKTQSRDIGDVWFGYRKSKRDFPILVAELKSENEKLPDYFRGFKVKYRLQNKVSNEAKSCIKEEAKLTEQTIPNDEETRKLQDCLTARSPSFFDKHKNLLIMSASRVKCKNYTESKPEDSIYNTQTCVVLYVKIKGIIPLDEDPFPEDIDGFPVDVREAYFDFYGNTSLEIGCKLETDYKRYGSLGGFVKLPNGQTGALTCWHIFITEVSKSDLYNDFPHHRNFKSNIYNFKCKVGRISESKYIPGDEFSVGIDAALIEITDPTKVPKNGHFPEGDDDSALQAISLDSGDIVTSFGGIPRRCTPKVVKYGAASKRTFGQVAVKGCAMRKWDPLLDPFKKDARLHQQIEVFPDKNLQDVFATYGDSGSLVLVLPSNDDENIRALGLIVGGTTYNSVIITPIWSILESFNLPPSLLSFEKSRIDTIEKQIKKLHQNMNDRFDKVMERLP